MGLKIGFGSTLKGLKIGFESNPRGSVKVGSWVQEAHKAQIKKLYLDLRKYFYGVEDWLRKYSQGVEDWFWK